LHDLAKDRRRSRVLLDKISQPGIYLCCESIKETIPSWMLSAFSIAVQKEGAGAKVLAA